MSRIIKCENGHFYDAEKFKECPLCSQGTEKKKNVLIEGGVSSDMDDVVTMAGPRIFGGKRRSIRIPHVSGKTVKPPEEIQNQEIKAVEKTDFQKNIGQYTNTVDIDTDKTVCLNQLSTGVDPVVGWLVCISGEEKGNDYRLTGGRNRIGRSLKMDVAIMSDKKITREEHCAIVYDGRSNASFLVPGNGTLTYYKGEMLRNPQELSSGDELEVGETRFIFIKFCEGERKWENYNER